MKNSVKLNFNRLICFFWALFIIFPWHSTANSLLKWITISGNITILSVFAILILMILMLYTINDGFVIKKTNVPVLIYCLLLFMAFCRGDAPITTRVLDCGNIIFQMAIYWGIQNRRTQKKTIQEFLALTVKLMNVNYCINVVFFLTRSFSLWGITSSDQARFGGGFFALGIVTGSVALYSLCTEEKILSKKDSYITLALVLFGFIVSAVRTNLIVFLGIACIIIFIDRNRSMQKSTAVTKILIVFGGLIAVAFLLRGNSYIAERLLSTNSLQTDGNVKIRISTLEYYLGFVKNHPLGAGFGYMVHFVHWNGSTLENQLSIDNSFLYCAIKCGIPTTIMFFYIVVIKPIINVVKSSNTKNFKICMISIWIGYIFATGIMTNQIFYSITNSAFIWAMLSTLSSNREVDEERMIYNE